MSEPTEARGDPEAPLADAEIRDKFHAMAGPRLGKERASAVESQIDNLGDGTDLMALLSEITASFED